MKPETFIQRRKALTQNIPANSLALFFAGDLVPSSADGTYPFVVNRNFFYLTQCEEDGLVLLVQNTNTGLKETLFIKDFNPTHEKWVGRSLKKEEAMALSGIQTIQPLSQLDATLNRLFLTNDLKFLHIDSERMNLKQTGTTAERFAKQLQDAQPNLTIVNLNKTINAMRRIKSEEEVKQIEAAIATTHRALDRMLANLKPGRMEYQVAADFAYQLQLENSSNSFATIAASGSDATILHYVSNSKAVKEGDLLLMDCGATYENYCADITRTYPVSGKFSARQKEIYEIVLKAQEAVIDAIRPGVSFQFLNEIVKEVYRTEAVKAKLIDDPSQVDEIYYHGVSHSLGLDTHDVGSLEGSVLEAGMVITVEPGLYSAKEGVGIRIEDDVLVTPNGRRNLSIAIPKTVADIEAILNPSK